MQTFVPFAHYSKSARCLDTQRLGKQRVEALQILKAIHDPTYGWQHHPAVTMWRHCPIGLVQYGLAVCTAWKLRDYQDTVYDKILAFAPATYDLRRIVYPKWWGQSRVHASHRSKLLQKNYDYYKQFGWTTPINLDYYWPS